MKEKMTLLNVGK